MYDLHVLILHCKQELSQQKLRIFQRSITKHNIIISVALVSFPPHKFERLTCCYFDLQDINIVALGSPVNGIILIPSFMKIGQFVQEIKWGTHK